MTVIILIGASWLAIKIWTNTHNWISLSTETSVGETINIHGLRKCETFFFWQKSNHANKPAKRSDTRKRICVSNCTVDWSGTKTTFSVIKFITICITFGNGIAPSKQAVTLNSTVLICSLLTAKWTPSYFIAWKNYKCIHWHYILIRLFAFRK